MTTENQSPEGALREAAQKALDALLDTDATGAPPLFLQAVIDTLRAALAAPAPQAPAWQPIETAPKDGREMFVVRAFGIDPVRGGSGNYTSDAYCVFLRADGTLCRWPHIWPPTHWMPLPAAPQTKEPTNDR